MFLPNAEIKSEIYQVINDPSIPSNLKVPTINFLLQRFRWQAEQACKREKIILALNAGKPLDGLVDQSYWLGDLCIAQFDMDSEQNPKFAFFQKQGKIYNEVSL